ncbi:MAG TPA: hypothetical protein VNO14_01055 [Blastocatellia bacterium]|nr:hypothetical protein [Blastocatellia bacterium]
MSSDHIQRQMDFILDQQAKFAEDMLKLEQQNKENTANIERLVDVVLSLANTVERHDEQIAALAERGRETDERLNSLINVVERYISGRDGK